MLPAFMLGACTEIKAGTKSNRNLAVEVMAKVLTRIANVRGIMSIGMHKVSVWWTD